MSAEPDTILVRRDPVDGRPMSEVALDVVRTAPNPSRELDMAFSLLLQDAELKRLRKVISDIDGYLEEAGDSELIFDHVANLLRQAGFARGPSMDEHFKGTSQERRA